VEEEEEEGFTPERREYARNALALLNSKFTGGREMTGDFLWSLASDNPSELTEDFVMKLLTGMTTIAQFLTIMRHNETQKPPADTLAELGRIFAPPSG
jgi:hypothetical protein